MWKKIHEVEESTTARCLLPLEFVMELAMFQELAPEKYGQLLIGQYQVAAAKDDWEWVRKFQYQVEMFFTPQWILTNIPHRDPRTQAGSYDDPAAPPCGCTVGCVL